MSTQKGSFLPILIIGVLVTLIIVGAGGYYLGISRNSTTNQTENPRPQNQSPVASTQSGPYPSTSIIIHQSPKPSPELEDLISYTIPAGWKKTSLLSGQQNLPALQSPDFIAETEGMFAGKPKTGILLYFNRYSNDPMRTFQQEENEFKNTAGVEKVTRVTVGGFPALHVSISYEGIRDLYLVIKDDYKWFITVEVPNASAIDAQNTLTKYQSQIDQLLSSIKFN